MRIARLTIKNFRGIREGELLLPAHAVLVGDNNIGKSTVLEAIDLVLGPERLKRMPVIDEHDFYAGEYLDAEKDPIAITIEAVVVALSDEQKRHFRDHLEWWREADSALLTEPPPEGVDEPGVVAALRVRFEGRYDAEEDDFAGNTVFASPQKEDGSYETFRTKDKRHCGFLYLRGLRTGTRALSLERGSLLDVILKLQDKRLTMWEDILKELRVLDVAETPEVTEILSGIQEAVRELVPADWASNPHMRVSDLTREELRQVLTVFMDTGAKRSDGEPYAAPFQHQGSGTINILVLALLSMIAELKANVIFAMEEPEVAIPPHAQKRTVDSVRAKSAQALFTSHSPYVIEEFPLEQILVLHRVDGMLSGLLAKYPIKPKKYKEEFRKRFCEMLLARRILIAEGRTEFDAIPAAARRLAELEPANFRSLEALGIAVIDAGTDSQIVPLGEFARKLGKRVFAIYDRQDEPQKTAILAAIDHPFESATRGFEKALVDGTDEAALRRYAAAVITAGDWPSHLAARQPTAATPIADVRAVLLDYFKNAKGEGSGALLLEQCAKAEMPAEIVAAIQEINRLCAEEEAAPAADAAPATPTPAAAGGADAPVAADGPLQG